MRQLATIAAGLVAVLAVAGCGGDDEPEAVAPTGSERIDAAGDGTAGSGIDDAPPSGRAAAAVDGLDLVFELPGALACSVSDDSVAYSYRIGDNEVTLGAGLNRVDGGWMGSIALTVADPEGEPGPVGYYPAPGDLGVLDEDLITVEGRSVRYRGPVLKQPANDGSQPPPVDVGEGTITATC